MNDYNYLNSFYNESQKRKVLFAKSYSQIFNFDKFILASRMIPFALNNPTPKIWVDEYNFQLTIKAEKTTEIIPNCIKAKNRAKHIDSKTMCSDLYNGLSINKLFDMSTKFMIIVADNNYFVSFYGIDNFVRTLFYKDQWTMISNLYFDIFDILYLIDFDAENKFQTFIPKKIPAPCQNAEAWLCSSLVDGLFFESFEKHKNIPAFSFLKKDK